MNILFLTLSPLPSLDIHNIYADLMVDLINRGHHPYIVVPYEKRTGERTELVEYEKYTLLKVSIGNVSNVSFVTKGISTVLLSRQFTAAILKYLSNVNIDLILYSTPPITLAGTVKRLKKKWHSKTYLMLKDIFPQNAVDLGLFRKSSILYRYFRYKERDLYRLSDWIGCMSERNLSYIKENNPEIPTGKLEICPNAIAPKPIIMTDPRAKSERRKTFGIPEDAIVFMYGGNLGKPQGAGQIAECMKKIRSNENIFTVICGKGTEYDYLKKNIADENLNRVLLINGLPKVQYDELLSICDVGLIFLDPRFTIPNFPSRILSYMEQAKPVLTVTDASTDINVLVENGHFGWSCLSSDADAFAECCSKIVANRANLPEMGMSGRRYLEKHLNVSAASEAILKHLE